MEANVNPRVTQELLGHRDVETTLGIYTTVTEKIKERDASKLHEKLATIYRGNADA